MGGNGEHQDGRQPASAALLKTILVESHDLITAEDNHVRQQRRVHGLSYEAQQFLLPFWKIESLLKDMLPRLETFRLLIILFRHAGSERLQLIPSIIANRRTRLGHENLQHLANLYQTGKTFENMGRSQLTKFFKMLEQVSKMEKILLRQSPEFYARIDLSKEMIQEFMISFYTMAVGTSSHYTESVKEAIEKYNGFAEKYTQPLVKYLKTEEETEYLI